MNIPNKKNCDIAWHIVLGKYNAKIQHNKQYLHLIIYDAYMQNSDIMSRKRYAYFFDIWVQLSLGEELIGPKIFGMLHLKFKPV